MTGTEPAGPRLEGPARSPSPLKWGTGATVGAVMIAAALVVVVVVVVAAMRHKSSSEPATVGTSGTTTTIPNHPAPAPVGFGAASVRIQSATGAIATWCMLVADVEPLRQQGLMFVSDPKLGGYAGMLFTWPADSTERFWMRNTPQPLTVAYFRSDGTWVSMADMAPCGDSGTCPVYPASGAYRSAIEVPQGRAAALGIGAGSKIVPQGTGVACPKASTSG